MKIYHLKTDGHQIEIWCYDSDSQSDKMISFGWCCLQHAREQVTIAIVNDGPGEVFRARLPLHGGWRGLQSI